MCPRYRGQRRGQSSSQPLESQAQPKLDLALRECRSKAQGRARRKSARSMHVKRGEPRSQTEERAHLIIYAGKVRMICDVESLGRELQFCLLADFMLPTQAHVEIGVGRAKSGITTGSDRTFVSGVIVSVDLAACQQVERMSTIVGKNRRQLKARKERILPGAFDYASHHDFMALIEFRKPAVGAQVARILRAIIAVEIRRGIEAFAKSVVAKQGEVIAEALLDPENCSLINGRTGWS